MVCFKSESKSISASVGLVIVFAFKDSIISPILTIFKVMSYVPSFKNDQLKLATRPKNPS